MSLELKEKIKQRDLTPKSVGNVFKYSINGIRCYAKDGKSVILYSIGAIFEILLLILIKASLVEWLIIIFLLGSILAVELLNTAIEAVCDLITKEYNPFVKMAKDCGSAATFVLFVAAIIVNLILIITNFM